MTPVEVLASLLHGDRLSETQSEEVFEHMLSGHFDQAQIGSFLSLIQGRGVTPQELIGAARVMRRHVTTVPAPHFADAIQTVIVDTCGTGGGTKTFNISTSAAFVVAGASPHHSGGPLRVLVAKHGNLSRTGRGSAEVLAALGVNVDAPPATQSLCLARAGVCFCFAIHHHPATRHAAPVRKSLGFPTVFNLLGPLANPANADCQIIGTYRPEYVDLLAHTLAGLGARSAMVVHGHSGMDEISTTGPTRIARVLGGKVEVCDFDATSVGVARADLSQLTATTVEHSASMLRDVLAGKPGPIRDIVLLNAAGALIVSGAAASWADGLVLAAAAVDSGRAAAALRLLAETARSAPP